MASTFLTPIRVQKLGAQTWILIDDLQFQSDAMWQVVVAPRGFQTDLASIPRFLWAVFPKVDKYDAAAVIHDAGYAGALVDMKGDRMIVTKAQADRLFREGCRVLEVNGVVAWLMYTMVRLFGDPDDHPLVENRPDVSAV